MTSFMDKDFLLDTETARQLYAQSGDMPIFDYHCHLSPKEIWENKAPANLAEIWLGGDHYKWRGMRGFGLSEKYMTGDASPYEKFAAYARVLPSCIGNPLYHWSHLELQRYFDIHTPLSEKTAADIWQAAQKKIEEGDFRPQSLIVQSGVYALCTTDDPVDSLEYHKLLAEDTRFTVQILPAFRPDKALHIEKADFKPWLAQLCAVMGRPIKTFADLTQALTERIDHFHAHGCRASDHAFEYVPYVEASVAEIEAIFAKENPTQQEADAYKTALMQHLAKEYHARGWGMELHIAAMRNNNAGYFETLGADKGFDSISDHAIAYGLSRLLDSLGNQLPKTILFTLNPKDNYVLGTMLGNFQSDEAPSKMQFGSAWWFNDNLAGMQQQMTDLANLGVLGKFIGMLTDSRSFLSYPRHEYFRRIFCGMVGRWVEAGMYPKDMETLSQMAKDVFFYNAKAYFGIK